MTIELSEAEIKLIDKALNKLWEATKSEARADEIAELSERLRQTPIPKEGRYFDNESDAHKFAAKIGAIVQPFATTEDIEALEQA